MMENLMAYFHAVDALDLALLLLNGVLASAIFGVLLFARGSVYRIWQLRWYERCVRFALAAAYGVLAVRVWLGWYYTPVEPTHVAVNVIVLVFVVLAHGDVSIMIAALREARVIRERGRVATAPLVPTHASGETSNDK